MTIRPQDTLTVAEAFRAAFVFLEAYWERGERQQDQIADLLSGMNHHPDEPYRTADAAQWDDFIDALVKVRSTNT